VDQQESCDGGVVSHNSNSDVHGNVKLDPQGRGGSSDLPQISSSTCSNGNNDPNLEENPTLESQEESNNDGKHQFCSKELMITNSLHLATEPQQATESTDTNREQAIPITNELVSLTYSRSLPKDYDQSIDQSIQELKENKGKEVVDKSRSREPPSQQEFEIPSQQPEQEGFIITSSQSAPDSRSKVCM